MEKIYYMGRKLQKNQQLIQKMQATSTQKRRREAEYEEAELIFRR